MTSDARKVGARASPEFCAQLTQAFQALPMDGRRVQRHIDCGHVKLGDFLQQYEMFRQARVLSRPDGRNILRRGDCDVYTTNDGYATVTWSVASLDRLSGDAIFRVTIDDCRAGAPGPRHASVLWNVRDRKYPDLVLPADAAPLDASAICELFGASGADGGHPLDLWDWNAEQPVRVDSLGNTATVRRHNELDDAWLVETPKGVFTWTPIDGRNLVSPASGPMPSADYLRILFARRPEQS